MKYIESHTTGTKAGDPIECKAIATSMCKIGSGRTDGPLLIGALKTNIGHTEYASGLAAIAKVIISYQNKCIPKNLHLTELNPDIPELFDGSLKPLTENTPFEGHRFSPFIHSFIFFNFILQNFLGGIVSLNNFGFGGANTHLIIESYDKEPDDNSFKIDDEIPRLVLMCGRTQDSIKVVFDYIKEQFKSGKMSREFLSLINDISEQERMLYRGSLLLQMDRNYFVSYNKICDKSETEIVW